MTREENLVSAIQAVVVGTHCLRLMVCAPHQQPCTATRPPSDRDLALRPTAAAGGIWWWCHMEAGAGPVRRVCSPALQI